VAAGARYRRIVTHRLDWERAAKREIVRTRGADHADRSSVGAAVWITDRERERLIDAGWQPPRRGGGMRQRDGRELLRILRRLDVTVGDAGPRDGERLDLPPRLADMTPEQLDAVRERRRRRQRTSP
jgi:hypothetical protein